VWGSHKKKNKKKRCQNTKKKNALEIVHPREGGGLGENRSPDMLKLTEKRAKKEMHKGRKKKG